MSVLCGLVLAVEAINSAAAQPLVLEVDPAGYARYDQVVEAPIVLADRLADGASADAHAPARLRVVELDDRGRTVDPLVPYQFESSEDGRGTLVWLMKGPTAPDRIRRFGVRIDTSAGALPAFTSLVCLSGDVEHEGQSSFRIQTPAGTWYYHQRGAGFASLDDADGNDWLGYSTAPRAAGEFRGTPNMGHPEGYMHPGKHVSSSRIVAAGPLRVVIESVSDDGVWAGRWAIYPQYATMTVLKTSHPFWFLYEGTPGGALEPDRDWLVRSDGARLPLSESWEWDLPGPEWICFADGSLDRSIFFIHHEDDEQIDSYRPMADPGQPGMTVFGFGRQRGLKLMTDLPQHFTVGLIDSRDPAVLEQRVASASRPMSITVSPKRRNERRD